MESFWHQDDPQGPVAVKQEEGIVYINGDFRQKREASISVFDHGLLYGDGVQDTLVAWNGCIFKLEPHIERLMYNAQALKIVPPVSGQELQDLIKETARRSNLKNIYIKILLTRGISPTPLLDPRPCKPGVVIIAVPYPSVADPTKDRAGIRAKLTSVRRVSRDALDARIKSLNYLAFVMARIEAIDAGFDEALIQDAEGYVCEAAGWNVLTTMKGVVSTPSTSIIEGITRATVMEICERLSIPHKARPLTSYDLYVADEVFVSSTAGGLVPVVNVDGRTIGSGEPGPIFTAIRREFRHMLENREHGTPIYS
jgi:branched-chain amino acid aminotransferase